MHNNYILKQAVLTALTVLSLGMQSQVFAVGLGDIEVKSYIGQPLQAKIKVQGVEGLKDQACFRLGDDSGQVNQVSRAQLKLGKIKGDEAVLTITTNDVINEPIVSLSVIAECDSTFRRDYVLLIDPLLTTELQQPSDEESINSVEIADNIVEKSAVAESNAIKTNVGQTIRVKKSTATKQGKNSNAVNSDNIVLSVNTEKKPASLPITKESKPRLSISGGVSDNQANMIGLR
ncbi:MAG: hypothetical protein CTY27_06360, partial [Methylotenera sp.]